MQTFKNLSDAQSFIREKGYLVLREDTIPPSMLTSVNEVMSDYPELSVIEYHKVSGTVGLRELLVHVLVKVNNLNDCNIKFFIVTVSSLVKSENLVAKVLKRDKIEKKLIQNQEAAERRTLANYAKWNNVDVNLGYLPLHFLEFCRIYENGKTITETKLPVLHQIFKIIRKTKLLKNPDTVYPYDLLNPRNLNKHVTQLDVALFLKYYEEKEE
ncbi:hypothetical protein Q8V59_004211 [Vibrio vulnificus]|nr:hypothetical protein [Vibrio vulnificus]